MLRSRERRALSGLALAVGTAWLASCASILGIEELQPSEGGASGGSSSASSGSGTGSSGASGSATGSGGSSGSASGGATSSGTAGGSGSTGSAGASGASTGSGGAPAAGGAAGSATDGGSDRGGSGGGATDAGDARPPDTGATITVTGTVVDIWRHPYPGAPVMIGNTVVMTNASGVFTIPNVTVPYNVSMLVETPSFYEAWEFIGLTRANPTLQFDDDMDPQKSATLTATSPAAAGTTIFTWASPDGFFDKTLNASGLSSETVSWSGPLSSVGVAHALKWTTMLDGRPAAYAAYDEKPATLANSGTLSLAMDLAPDVIPTDTVSGMVTLGELMPPFVDAMLTFPTGGGITVASQAPLTGNGFSYLVPRLPNTSITLVATAGNSSTGPFGLVHKRGTAAQLAGAVLAVPDPAHLALPRDNGTASPVAELSWTGPDQVYVFGAWVVDTATRYRVVTKEKKGTSFVAHLPRLTPNSGRELAVGKKVNWWAEMQGTYASVDEAAGPQGYADPVDGYDDQTLHRKARILGPHDKDGYRVTSDIWQFTSVAP